MDSFETNEFINILSAQGFLRTVEIDYGFINIRGRNCNKCSRYLGRNMCRLLGRIVNKKGNQCSWFKNMGKEKPISKKCSSCGEVKTINEFYKDNRNPGGYRYNCIKCVSLYYKECQKSQGHIEKLREASNASI